MEDSIEASFWDACDEYDYEILSLHISLDHVHLFLSAHPNNAPSKIVRTVNRITAQGMWELHEPFLERYLRGSGFWERSYYIGTGGTAPIETTERNIE